MPKGVYLRTDEHRRINSESHKGKKSWRKGKNRLEFLGENNPFFGKHHSEESNEKNRKKHLGKHFSPATEFKVGHKEFKEIQNKRLKKSGSSNGKRISFPQKILFNIIKEKYSDAELEYRIGYRFADIAIPSLNLDIEYDGQYWHKNKLKDSERDNELLNLEWKTIRVDKYILQSIKELGINIIGI